MITILLALATVAADPGSKTETTAAAPATATTTTAQPAAEPVRRYCINEALTGSRMAKKVCRTRQEWARAGVDLR